MKRVLDQSSKGGAGSLATRYWRPRLKTAVHDGYSGMALQQVLAVPIGRSARGFGYTQTSIATCVVTTVACVRHQLRRDANLDSSAFSELRVKRLSSA